MFRIMKINEFDDAVTFRASCNCTDRRHDMTIDIEADKEMGDIILHFYIDLESNVYWGGKSLLKRIVKKITYVLRLIFTGRIEMENDFILDSKKQIEDFISTITRAYEILKNKS
jgi:hypothetical protein